jgi:hypothetical protein
VAGSAAVERLAHDALQVIRTERPGRDTSRRTSSSKSTKKRAEQTHARTTPCSSRCPTSRCSR